VIGGLVHGDVVPRIAETPGLDARARVRPVSEGAVVDGALVTRKLRGDFAKNQLPLMMGLLDGAHSHEEIATALGLTQEQTYSALALLWTSGVIEDADYDTGATAPDTAEDTKHWAKKKSMRSIISRLRFRLSTF